MHECVYLRACTHAHVCLKKGCNVLELDKKELFITYFVHFIQKSPKNFQKSFLIYLQIAISSTGWILWGLNVQQNKTLTAILLKVDGSNIIQMFRLSGTQTLLRRYMIYWTLICSFFFSFFLFLYIFLCWREKLTTRTRLSFLLVRINKWSEIPPGF